MKKLIATVLCLVLVLSMAACTPKENLTGTWSGTIDMTAMFNEQMAAEPEMAEYVKLESVNLVYTIELREDGTCTMTFDADSLNAAIDQVLESVSVGMKIYLTDMFAAQGIPVDDLDTLLSSMGMDLDALLDELKTELLADDAFANLSAEAKYKAEDGKLYFSEDLDSEINTDEYNTYTLEGDTLTLEIGTMSVEDEDMNKYLFPMTLTRVK